MHPLLNETRIKLSFAAIAEQPGFYIACGVALAADDWFFASVTPRMTSILTFLIYKILHQAHHLTAPIIYTIAALSAFQYFLKRPLYNNDHARTEKSKPRTIRFLLACFIMLSIFIPNYFSPSFPLSGIVFESCCIKSVIYIYGTFGDGFFRSLDFLFCIIILSAFGSALPALIDGSGRTLSPRTKRGEFLKLFQQLTMGPLIAVIIFSTADAISTMIILAELSGADAAAVNSPKIYEIAIHSWLLLNRLFLDPAFSLFIVVLTAATLSRHYVERAQAVVAQAD